MVLSPPRMHKNNYLLLLHYVFSHVETNQNLISLLPHTHRARVKEKAKAKGKWIQPQVHRQGSLMCLLLIRRARVKVKVKAKGKWIQPLMSARYQVWFLRPLRFLLRYRQSAMRQQSVRHRVKYLQYPCFHPSARHHLIFHLQQR